MCFGGGGSAATATEDPAQELLDREAIRQANITLGKASIDKNFEQFNDPYYDSYKTAYKGNYVPQLDKQYNSAVGKMIATLAGRGMDRSSFGAASQGDLAGDYIDAKTTISGEADTAANTLRANVENSKSNLYALNSAAADPAAANAQAVGQAKTLVAPPQYSPLGEVFASALEPFSNFQASQNNTATRNYQSPFNMGRGGRNGAGSSTVVR